MDLNVEERVVMDSPTARGIDALPGDLASTENAAVIDRESDRRPRRSNRNRQAPAWMGDFLLGKDIDNALPPLGRGGYVTLLRDLTSLAPGLRAEGHVQLSG